MKRFSSNLLARVLALGIAIFPSSITLMAAPEAKSDLAIVLFRVKPNNIFRWERWAEAEVRVKNEGAVAQQARIVVDFPSVKDNFRAVFSRPVTLPPRSQQEIKFMVRFPSSFAMPSGGAKGFPVQVRLMRETSTLSQEIFHSVPASDAGLFLLWCGDGDASLAYHLKKSPREGDFKGLRDFSLVASRIENLPHHAMGYDSFDMVILSDWEQKMMDPLQNESLLNWVRRGGKLLVIAGPHWLARPNRFLAEKLPLWPVESYQTSVLPEVEAWAGDLGIADGVSVMDGPRAPAEILMGNEDQPLLMRRPLGLGFIFFLTLDVDRHNGKPAKGMTRFMLKALNFVGESPGLPAAFSESFARQALEQLVAVRIIPRERMMTWLGAYGLLIVLLLVIGRLTRRPEWSYAGVAILAAAWFFMMQQWSRRERKSSAGQIERVRAYLAESREGDPFTLFTGVEGFFPSSPRQLNAATAGLSTFDATVFPIAGLGADRAERIEIQSHDRAGIGSWQLTPNTLRIVSIQSLLQSAHHGARYTARLTPEGLLLEVQSHFPWKLEQPFFKWNRFALPLPDIAAGQTARIETWKHSADWGRYQSGMIQSGQSAGRNLLRQVILPDALRGWPEGMDVQRTLQRIHGKHTRQMALGGFTSEDPLFWSQSDAKGTEATMGLWMVLGNENLLSAAPEFSMPPGIAGFELQGKEKRISYLGDSNFGGTHEDQIPAAFVLPSCLREIEAGEIVVHADFGSLHFEPAIQVGIGSPTAEPRQWIAMPWSRAMRVPGSPFVLKEGADRIWVKVDIRRRENARAASAEGADSLSQSWYLRDLDVSLRGKKSAGAGK